MDDIDLSITPAAASYGAAFGSAVNTVERVATQSVSCVSTSIRDLDIRLLRLHVTDTCLVVCAPVAAGARLRLGSGELFLGRPLARGVSIASRDLACGDEVRRCGIVIGWVTRPVAAGAPLNIAALAVSQRPPCIAAMYTTDTCSSSVAGAASSKCSCPCGSSGSNTRRIARASGLRPT